MPSYLQTAQAVVSTSNLLTGLGMVSLAVALAFSYFRRSSQYPRFAVLLSILFLIAGMSRLIHAFTVHHIIAWQTMVTDSLTALVAVAAGIAIWPILSESLRIPKYQELAIANKQLDSLNEELRLSHKEIELLNRQLRERVHELAEANAALQHARDQALEASNLKSAFVANISHELRTPLSGILGLIELLLRKHSLDDDSWQTAKMVQDCAEALLNVVNDILDLSRIEAGKIFLEEAPLNPVYLLQECTRLMAPTAHKKELKYELVIDQKMPELVYGDISRLRQILLNLIGNALKFTENGKVQVRADVKQINDDNAVVEFAVIDTGIGIAPEDQRFLFVPFGQIDNSSTRKFGGTGLGLAISKRFVEMMDGKIGVKSEKEKGSTFWFRIAFQLRKAHETEGANYARPSVEPVPAELALGRRVLVVEDSPVLQHLALRQLAGLGVEAEGTALGKEAIELGLSGRFDIMFLDVNLPDISGLEVSAAIRDVEAAGERKPIPIIAMTAGAMKGDRERALEAGMNDYLAKPVSIEQLKRKVELWLAKCKKPAERDFDFNWSG